MWLRQIFLYALLTVISLLNAISVCAEERGAKPTERDSIQLIRGIAAGYDVAGTVMRMVGDYGQYEGMVRLNLRDRYFPTVELGLGTAHHDYDIVTGIGAKVRSPYARIGCDFNMSKNKHDFYRVMVGLRYAFTSFKTEIDGRIEDPVWGGMAPYTFETKSCSYHWAEVLFAVDAMLWGPVRLGWSFRYKMKLSHSDMAENNLWYVPGFGKHGNKLGGTFYVTLELWRKNKKAL